MMKQIIMDGINGIDNVYGLNIPKNVNRNLWNRAMNDIAENNTWCPDISRIIYNVGTKTCRKSASGKPKTYDVLSCTVFFNDDTKVTVTNSENDPVEIIEVDGVKIASERAKEAALVYAICKKLIGTPDSNGEVQGNGFGRILRELVTSAWDQQLEEKKARDRKIEAHAKHIETQKNAKPKVKRESLAKTVDRLSSIINSLERNNSFSSKTNIHNSNCFSACNTRKRDARGRFI